MKPIHFKANGELITHPFQSKWRAHNPRRALLTSKKCPKETKASTIISLYKFLRQWQVPVNQIGKNFCHEIRDLRLDPHLHQKNQLVYWFDDKKNNYQK